MTLREKILNILEDENVAGKVRGVNGAYNQRRLGTLPTIASANTLTLTYGNTFKISGTTTINNITTTGWP